jgi:hypothetical protein
MSTERRLRKIEVLARLSLSHLWRWLRITLGLCNELIPRRSPLEVRALTARAAISSSIFCKVSQYTKVNHHLFIRGESTYSDRLSSLRLRRPLVHTVDDLHK